MLRMCRISCQNIVRKICTRDFHFLRVLMQPVSHYQDFMMFLIR